jgi:LmbE family N-acetylglucosaminyl deacetylase
MNMKRVLVVAAHPDDDVLGCGATMSKLIKSGKAVRVVFLGEGSTCRYEEGQIDSDEAQRTIEQRNGFAREALAVLGVDDYVFHNLPCGRFDTIPIIDIGKRVELEIAAFRPDTVISHFANDTNNDHRLAFQATLQATRPRAQNLVSNVLSFEVLSSTEWRFTDVFNPNFFINVENEIDAKIEAFGKYVTEERPFPFPRSPEGLMAQSRVRGMQAGCRNAEAFVIVRSIEL